MVCNHCLADNQKDCLFCPVCGNPMQTGEHAVTPPSVSNSSVIIEILNVQTAVSEVGASISPVTAAVALTLTSDAAASNKSATPAAGMPVGENRQLAQANLFRMRKSWDEATNLCILVLRDSPADPAAHSLLGDIYKDQGKLEESVRWYRMAVDLKPNPFDLANLQNLEKKLASRTISAPADSRTKSQFPLMRGSQSARKTDSTDTAQQRWLKGITVTAVSFLSLFIIYLLVAPARHRTGAGGAIPEGGVAYGYGSTSTDLPPPVIGGPAVLPSGERPNISSGATHTAGTGLSPDLNNGTVQAVLPPAATPDGGLLPAPVKSVSPLGSGASQMSELSPNDGSAVNRPHSNALQSGMEMAGVQSAHGVAMVTIVAPEATDPNTSRETLVRNLFRAANTIFSNDASLTRATVSFRAGSASGEVIFAADIDRTSATVSDPEHDDISVLSSHLQIH